MRGAFAAFVALTALTGTVGAQGAKAPRYGAFGIDLTAGDTSVRPGDDFWTFANGAWNKRTAIPADHLYTGPGDDLDDEADLAVRGILEDADRNPAIGRGGRQLGDLYAAYMDQAAIERAGTAPLRPYLAQVDAADTPAKLQVLFAEPG